MSALDDVVGIFDKGAAGEIMRLAAKQAKDELTGLRADLQRFQNLEQERAEFIRQVTGSTSLEHFIVRFKEQQAALDQLKDLLRKNILPYLERRAMLDDDGDALDLREAIIKYQEAPHETTG
jgi:hypothetical protein